MIVFYITLLSTFFPAPDGVPEFLTVGDKTSTNCEVIWEEVVNSHPDPDGAVTGYFIYYRKAGLNDSFNKFNVHGANTTRFIMENLEEFTNYEFKVVAYNEYGEGNSSEVSHCLTEEDGAYTHRLIRSKSEFNFFLYLRN